MSAPIPEEILQSIEQHAAACVGDVGALVQSARAVSPAVSDDFALAEALEQAAARRAAANDRTGAWWLACAQATLRPSPIASPQEDAEVCIARLFGELPRSLASHPLPEPARWIVAGVAEPRLDPSTIELARRNARSHVEHLAAELDQRAGAIRARFESGDVAGFETAISSYVVAGQLARTSLRRAIDHVVAKTAGDANLAQAGAAAMDDVDSTLPMLLGRVANARSLAAAPPPPPAHTTGVDRPSFAGAAPPSFHSGSVAGVQAPVSARPVSAPVPSQSPLSPVESLDAAMRAAFESAWATPTAESRAAFEQAVRARYELETAAIPDAAERQRVLDHYVAHALTQLPP